MLSRGGCFWKGNLYAQGIDVVSCIKEPVRRALSSARRTLVPVPWFPWKGGGYGTVVRQVLPCLPHHISLPVSHECFPAGGSPWVQGHAVEKLVQGRCQANRNLMQRACSMFARETWTHSDVGNVSATQTASDIPVLTWTRRVPLPFSPAFLLSGLAAIRALHGVAL